MADAMTQPFNVNVQPAQPRVCDATRNARGLLLEPGGCPGLIRIRGILMIVMLPPFPQAWS